ncbi:MAG: DUF695 domain-containing protein [Campylobacterales bacterium]|nr:DUF695 domain-containing protein [Campylobacterales bacterium]
MTQHFILPLENDAETALILHTNYLDEAPIKSHPWLLWCFIKLKYPQANGCWSDEEQERLLGLAESIDAALEALDVLHVGVRVQEGWCELYYYAEQFKGFEATVAPLVQHAGYSFEINAARDPKWELYRFTLTPDAKTLRKMQSLETLEALEAEGDDLSRPRAVEHYLFFQTAAQRDRAAEALEGFTCKEKTHNAKEEHAYGAVLEEVRALDDEGIFDAVSKMFELAQKEHGLYEGWSTTLAS